jgi:N-acetylglucosaminyldiphosphoundecaprenol N-acetyl-beta-D-mannosaminyltransferase
MNQGSLKHGLILGVKVHALTMAATLEQILEWINHRQPHYICCVPAHSIMDCVDSPEIRKVFNTSGLNTPDGMAIVWLLRCMGNRVERVYGPDLLVNACAYGLPHGWSHYFYGAAPAVLEGLVLSLQNRFSGLDVAGFESPPFRPLTEEEKGSVIERIKSSKPDILWVGLGSPRQEEWMAEFVGLLDVPVLIGVGAAFDFLSGNKKQAPHWIQRSGLEWLYRLINEPRRLWRRYLINYPRFILLLILSALGLKSYNGG